MTISAIVTASQDIFVATLNDGRQMEAHTLSELAKVLHSGGIENTAVRCEWHAGLRMLTAGQQVALNAALRSLECDESTRPVDTHPRWNHPLRH